MADKAMGDTIAGETATAAETGADEQPGLAEMAMARIRQLSAHEVGHTLGLGHNYYASSKGRISVMDYPHPLVTLNQDGVFDVSDAYDVGIGAWDKVAITYGYQDFAERVDAPAALDKTLTDGNNLLHSEKPAILTRILDTSWEYRILVCSKS